MPNNFVGFAVPPILWLDARNVDGVKNRSLDSSFITKWLDLSGNLHHVTTAVAERSPRISESSVIFDGTDDVLIHDSRVSTEDLTMVAVAKLATVDTSGTNKGGAIVSVTELANNPNDHRFDAIVYREFDPKRFIHGSDHHNRFHASSVTETQTDPVLIFDSSVGPTFEIYRNGNLVSSEEYQSAPKQNVRFAIGNRLPFADGTFAENGFWRGSISEVIVFNRELTNDERVYLTAYLAKKWHMQTDVDSDDDGLKDAVDPNPIAP